jgi:subtilisin family serine protease
MAKKVNKTAFTYGGVTLQLSKRSTQAAVQYSPELRPAAKRGAAAPPTIGGFELLDSKRAIDSRLDQLRARPEINVGSHVWQVDDNSGGSPLIPTGTIYIEFKPDTDIYEQRDVLESLSLSVKENVAPDAYRVTVTADSPNPIKCVTLLQKKRKLVAVAEPEFVTLPAERSFAQPSGNFIRSQWHHENTGQQIPIVEKPNSVFSSAQFRSGADAKVRAAWQELQSMGSTQIKIAVIDTGFAVNHPQLKGDGTKVRTPFNAANRSTDVSPLVRYANGTMGVANHGTSCAAVAAGALDTAGILGAAPNARIIPIKLDVLSDEAIRNAFEHALLNGADIISCSLGFPQPIPLSTFVSNYIAKVATEGRGGRGIPIFVAAGNANPASNNQPRQVSDFAAHPNVICVTASNSLDEFSSYSFYGSNAFMCAPTNGNNGVGITTASCSLGADGRSVALGYTSGFGGTSSATPLAAGICALMLTANPDLRLPDIRFILSRTTDKIGPAGTYNASNHSIYYGFGRINALKAVQMAKAAKAAAAKPASSGGGAAPAVPVTTVRGRVTSANLNVRSGPSTSHAKVAAYKKGDVITLLEKVGTWWRIGAGQFVSGDFVQVL